MEKFLLILALLGSAHLGLRSVLDAGRRLFGFGPPKSGSPQAIVEQAPGHAAAVADEAPKTDWTPYDVPAFLRRGIALPKLAPVTPKVTESGSPGGPIQIDVSAIPEAEESVAFEIIA